ncbi:MAG: hypothetical protein AAF456_04405 [Planctomycetota bacterium]
MSGLKRILLFAAVALGWGASLFGALQLATLDLPKLDTICGEWG